MKHSASKLCTRKGQVQHADCTGGSKIRPVGHDLVSKLRLALANETDPVAKHKGDVPWRGRTWAELSAATRPPLSPQTETCPSVTFAHMRAPHDSRAVTNEIGGLKQLENLVAVRPLVEVHWQGCLGRPRRRATRRGRHHRMRQRALARDVWAGKHVGVVQCLEKGRAAGKEKGRNAEKKVARVHRTATCAPRLAL